MKYQIHVNYLNNRNILVKAGEYDESEFDLAEARHKSIVTLVDVKPTVIEKVLDDTLKVLHLGNSNSDVLNLEAIQKQVTIEKLKINSVDRKDIADLKYVSAKNADKVLEQRKISKFESYVDLNNRVPLSFNRNWEDITPIDFETTVSITESNSLYTQ